MKYDTTRMLRRDCVISLTRKGERVGVYYADTDGKTVLAEMHPRKANKIIKKHNALVL